MPDFQEEMDSFTQEEMDSFTDKMAKGLGEVLDTLLEKGFEPPLYWALIASNGAMLTGCYEPCAEGESLQAKLLFEHYPDRLHPRFMRMPFNMMFVDGTGRVSRLTMRAPERNEKQN
jgi:hypothetical protein